MNTDPAKPRSSWPRWRAGDLALLPGLVFLIVIELGLACTLNNLPAVFQQIQVGLLNNPAARQHLAQTLVDTPAFNALGDWQRQAGWLLLHDLGDAVSQGRDGWLFLSEEFAVHRDRDDNARTRAGAVIRIGRALTARGITLLVAVVPDKSRIRSDQLGRLRRPMVLTPRLATWIAEVETGGVPVVDLSAGLSAPGTFLRTDTHWTEKGSRLAARALAARLQNLGANAGPRAVSRIVYRQQHDTWGDLVHLAGVDSLPAILRPAGDHDWHSVVESQADSDDLLGDSGVSRMILLGTSFSRRSNFLPFLQLETGRVIADFSMDGGDFNGSARRYFSADAFAENPPSTIVWEIPERVLETPLGPGEVADLDHLIGQRIAIGGDSDARPRP